MTKLCIFKERSLAINLNCKKSQVKICLKTFLHHCRCSH